MLVVDDDPDTRWMTQEALHDLYEVAAASSPAEALARARERTPDAVIVDLTLERASGWDLIRSLETELGQRRVPVIVLSARPAGQPPAGVAPCAAYLTKPCRMAELREVLGRLVSEATSGATP